MRITACRKFITKLKDTNRELCEEALKMSVNQPNAFLLTLAIGNFYESRPSQKKAWMRRENPPQTIFFMN